MSDPEIDLEALEQAYEAALQMEKSGNRNAAIDAWRHVLDMDPDDCGGAEMRLAALGQGRPERASPAYVMTLFDQHAEIFESILVDQLGYDIPGMIRAALKAQEPENRLRLLDLGCGTGLVAEALENMTAERTGIDLSPDMVAIAAESDLYADLYSGDAVQFVEQTDQEWDIIVAADMLPYLGDLSSLFAAVSKRLSDGGMFVFSTELPDANTSPSEYGVGPQHRFFHTPAYILQCLTANGFTPMHDEAVTVRMEDGKPIRGQLILAGWAS